MSNLSIDSISSVSTYLSTQQQNSTDKLVANLGNALKSSDTEKASEYATTLQEKVMSALQSTTSEGSASTLATLSQNVDAVLKALGAGDTAKAQEAYSNLNESYTNLRSVGTALHSGGDDGASVVTKLINSASGTATTTSSSDSVSQLMSAYADYMYSLSYDGKIQQGSSSSASQPGSVYNATA